MLLSVLLGVAEPGFEYRPVVLDTTLLQQRPEMNFGREQYLLGGDGRAILIAFPDVVYRKPTGKRVGSASLVFKAVRPEAVGSVGVARMLRGWGEGKGRVTPTNMGTTVALGWGESSWSTAFKGGREERWATPGAGSERDSRAVEGASAEQSGDVLRINGLGSVVQGWISSPERNYGLRLTFGRDAVFYSGEWGAERPRLEIEWVNEEAGGTDLAVASVEPEGAVTEGQSTVWNATVVNLGESAVSGASGTWTTPEGREVPVADLGTIEAGQAVTVRLEVAQAAVYGDPRRSVLSFAVSAAGDRVLENNTARVYTAGLPVAVEGGPGGPQRHVEGRRLVDFVNEVVLPFSRFVFAPEGVTERLRYVSSSSAASVTAEASAEAPAGAWPWAGVSFGAAKSLVRALVPVAADSLTPPTGEDLSIHGKLGWLPDTRDDGLRVPALALPDYAWGVVRQGDSPLPESGFLSRVEAGYLQLNVLKRGSERGWGAVEVPNQFLVQVKDTLGRPLTGGRIVVPGDEKPLVDVSLSTSGFAGVAVPAGTITLEKPFLEFELRRGQATEKGAISYWDLVDWRVRGNLAAASLEVTMMTTDIVLDTETNLAEGRIITDSQGRLPAELTKLVDGQYGEGVVIEPGNWVEIDIGRDRTLGAVELVFEGVPMSAVEIYTFKTGQGPTDAVAFYRDPNLVRTARVFGAASDEGLRVVLKSSSVQSRYVRLIHTGAEPVTVKEIRILPGR